MGPTKPGRSAPGTDSAPETRVALVTGASSGIGAAVTGRLCADGYTVHALARRRDRLQAVCDQTGAIPHQIDVTNRRATAALIAELGRLDVVVNNAGIGRMGTGLAEASSDDVVVSVETNVVAPLEITRGALGPMVKAGRGHIVLIGSMAGLYPLPAAIYGATKGAIHLLAMNLRLELAGSGIRVTEICPGRVTTEFYDHAIADPAAAAKARDSQIREVSAAECADAVAYALGVADHVNINRIELQPTEQTYGGSAFTPTRAAGGTNHGN